MRSRRGSCTFGPEDSLKPGLRGVTHRLQPADGPRGCQQTDSTHSSEDNEEPGMKVQPACLPLASSVACAAHSMAHGSWLRTKQPSLTACKLGSTERPSLTAYKLQCSSKQYHCGCAPRDQGAGL